MHVGLPLRGPAALNARVPAPGLVRAASLVGALVVAGALWAPLTACATAPPGRLVDSGTLPDGAPLTIPVDAGHNAVDVQEALRLLERHEARAPLVALIVERATDGETREVARRVASDAARSDATTRELLARWGQPEVQRTDTALRSTLNADVERLRTIPVEAFDDAALAVLLRELQADVVDGAIARNDGRDDDARRLGDEIVTAAQVRIERVKQLLGAA